MKRQNAQAAVANTECPQVPADARAAGNAFGHGAKSEAVRERALVALLSEKTLAVAARRCGVNEKTLRRWLADDEAFKQELAQMRRGLFETAMNRIHALAAVAHRHVR